MSGVWQNKLNLLAVCFSDWQEGPLYFLREAWLGDFFSLVDRDLIFSQFVNRDSSTWLLHFFSKYCTNFALHSNLSYLWCRYPGRAFLLPLFWILETMCLKSSWFKPERTWPVDRYMQIFLEKWLTRTAATMLFAQFHVRTDNFYSLRNLYNLYKVRCSCLC